MPEHSAADSQPGLDRAQLARFLDEELQGTEALLQVMGQEADALVADPEAVARLAGRKLVLVGQLEELHRARCALLRQAGLEPDRSGVERLLRSLDDPELGQRWQRLRQAVERCRDANLVNGAVVELNRQHTRRALELLRGHAPEATLYSATGSEQTAGSGRILAKA